MKVGSRARILRTFPDTISLSHNQFSSGNIASIVVEDQFKRSFGLDSQSEDTFADTKGWLVSIATAGAVFGCLGVCLSAQVNTVEET